MYSHIEVTKRPIELCVLSSHVIYMHSIYVRVCQWERVLFLCTWKSVWIWFLWYAFIFVCVRAIWVWMSHCGNVMYTTQNEIDYGNSHVSSVDYSRFQMYILQLTVDLDKGRKWENEEEKKRKRMFTFSYSLASLCVCSSLRCTNSSSVRSLTRFRDACVHE